MTTTTTTTTIRRATLDDLGPLAALFDQYRQFYEQAPDLTLATRYLGDRLRNGESVILVAMQGSPDGAQDGGPRAQGFCQLYPTFCSVEAAPIFVLYDLFVTGAVRQQGVGKALMQAAQTYAASTGACRLDLTTARTNAAGQALYESLGWQRDQVFLAYSLSLKQPATATEITAKART